MILSEEIPPVSGNVEEDGNSTVGLGTRSTNESDTGLGHPPVYGVEVIDMKEESDPTGCLVTNCRTLVFAVGASKKEPCLRVGRANYHPALRPPVVGERRRVLHQFESEYTGKEGDGGVVLVNDQGNQVDLHPGSVRTVPSAFRMGAR